MNTTTTPFEINKGTILINKIGINGILGRLSYPLIVIAQKYI